MGFKNKPWTLEDIQLLKTEYGKGDIESLCKALGRNKRGIYSKAERLGLMQALGKRISKLLKARVGPSHPAWKGGDRETDRRRRARRRPWLIANGSDRKMYYLALIRDRGICGICRKFIDDPAQVSFDHRVPLSKGGAHELENIQPAHRVCNARKRDN